MSEPPIKKTKFQNKKKFFQPKRKLFLEVGHKGFLATCNFNEKDCLRECYNILNQYAKELYGNENDSKDIPKEQNSEERQKAVEESVNDIADDLQMEITATQILTKSSTKRRFQGVDTGATNCIFVKTSLEDPKEIAERIIHDVIKTKQPKTRYLLRFLPIVSVCKANEKDILNAAGALCDRFFLKEHTTFSIIFNKRFNNDINRDNLIREIANLIHAKNSKNKVDLKHAKRSLIVEIIKGLCCLTVVDDYMAKKKYNLVELSRGNCESNEKSPVCASSQQGDIETQAEEKIKLDV